MYIYIYIYVYMRISIYTYIAVSLSAMPGSSPRSPIAAPAEDSAYGRFPKFHRVFVGPRPWHIEIRHRVKQTSTINLLGFETLKLKIRRLKLWKPTVHPMYLYIYRERERDK